MSGFELSRNRVEAPFFSICIPQYNRTSFLIEACTSLERQTFTGFEVCISDDCSTDGRADELAEFLRKSSLPFVYHRHESNRRFDANLRSAIGLARGRFAFLLGNDDSVASPEVLERLHAELESHADACVAITNYADYRTGRMFARVTRSGIVGVGPSVASSAFRNFSFVSGVILRTDKAREHATSRWDGSEMYQMYLGSRIIASGGALLYIQELAIRKDIFIPSETVDSYAARPRLDPCPIVERPLPLGQIGRLVADAIAPSGMPDAKGQSIERIFRQLYTFTFPFWILEYRRVQSRRYALGVCLGLRPANSMADLSLSAAGRVRLSLLFWMAAVAALVIPEAVLTSLQGLLYRAAKATA